MGLPHQSLKRRYWTDLAACHLTPCQHEMSLSFATCLRYDQQGKKGNRGRKLLRCNLHLYYPKECLK